MKTLFRVLLPLTMVAALSACGQDDPTPPSTQLRDAVQKPINATNEAVGQVEDTQKRMDDALRQADGSAAQLDAATGGEQDPE